MRFLSFFAALVFACLSGSAQATSTCRGDSTFDTSRIAVAGGSITELIYFLNEQERLIAVDRTSNFPEAATHLPQIGYVRGLSSEGLLSLKPSLVMGEEDMGPPEVVAQLQSTGIDMITVPEAFTPRGVVDKLRCVAEVLSIEPSRIVAAERRLSASLDMLSKIANKKESAMANAKHTRDIPTAVVVLVFTEGAPVAAGVNTAGDGLIRMAGMQNALESMEGWKPLSAESLIKANPDYLIITNRAVAVAGGLEQVYKNPAVRLTRAGRKRQIIQMDGMTLLGFGPRTLDAAVSIAKMVEQ